jgi:hypothetical protein
MKKFAILSLGLFLAVNMNAWYVPGAATAKKVVTSAWNHKKKVIGSTAGLLALGYVYSQKIGFGHSFCWTLDKTGIADLFCSLVLPNNPFGL